MGGVGAFYLSQNETYLGGGGGGGGGGGAPLGAFYLSQNETYLTPPPLLAYPPMYSVSDKLSNLPSPRKPKHSSPQKNPPSP